MINMKNIAALILILSSMISLANPVGESGAPTNCGGGVWVQGQCPWTAVGNCDGAQGTAVSMQMEFTIPENTGRYVAVAATSSDITFSKLDGFVTPIVFPDRYRRFQIGTPPNKINVGKRGVIEEWVLETLPANGDLYSGATMIGAADYSFYDPDKLWYKPDASYTGTDTFTYCAIDSSGRSNIATVTINVEAESTYTLPQGFASPGFGINKSPPADPGAWPSIEVSNFFYIDADHVSCSDSNTYGYPDVPRCSLPASLTNVSAGGKIVLAASTTDYELRDGSSWHQLNLNGTSGSEVWIVGDRDDAVKPIIVKNPSQSDGTLRVTGDHFIIAGVDFNGVAIDHQTNTDTHLTLRDSIVRNDRGTTGTPILFENDNVLLFNNTVYDNGIIEPDLATENDVHGTNLTGGTGHYILDILSYGNGGDSVQLTNNNTTESVYIGRLTCHSDAENCIDVKDFNKVVITEVTAYDYRQIKYGDGGSGESQAIYINDEGVQQNYLYVLNSRCWDSAGDVNGAASCFGAGPKLAGGRTYLVGNEVLWNPNNSGFYSGTGSGEFHMTLNTIANTRYGINVYNAASGEAVIVGNYIYNASDADYRIVGGDFDAFTLMDYNATDANPGTYLYGSNTTPTTASSLADFKTQVSGCTNCDENITLTFGDASLYDFSISGGTGVDFVDATIFGAGASQDSIWVDMNTDLGISSYVGPGGTTWPQNTDYDVGAYEDAP